MFYTSRISESKEVGGFSRGGCGEEQKEGREIYFHGMFDTTNLLSFRRRQLKILKRFRYKPSRGEVLNVIYGKCVVFTSLLFATVGKM